MGDRQRYARGLLAAAEFRRRGKSTEDHRARARDSKVEGKVALSLVIGEQGHATQIAVKTPLHADLDQNAIKALEKWRFEPATKGDQPVKVHATIEMSFRLANDTLEK